MPVGDVGSSRNLIQDLEDDNDDEDIIIPSNQLGKSKSKQDKTAWTIAEDKALCSAYLEAGGDVEIGTDQKRVDLWANIMRRFIEAQRENSSTINNRNKDSCFGRWRRISGLVSKWVGVYAEAQRKKKSGWNEDNVIGEAREIWEKTNNGKKFQLEHCWDILKHFPKWQGGVTVEDQESTHSSKRSNSDTPTIEIRPIGVKRSKRKGKSNISSQVDINDITNCINTLNTNREVDVERLQLEKNMFEFYKAKEETKKEERDQKRRFKMYSILMGKSILSSKEAELYARLQEEFENI
ncbi:hypothetical protein OROMI_016088 [Orobanche minor]